jgi:hypothetical protein
MVVEPGGMPPPGNPQPSPTADPEYVPEVIKQDAGAGSAAPGRNWTTPTDTRFNGLPGKPKVWKNTDTGIVSIVYFVPGSEPPIPLLFTTNQEELNIFFGGKPPNPDMTYTQAELDSFGAISFGSTQQIPKTHGDVWGGFLETMERAKETQPWLRDDEVFALYAGAWIEGRNPYRWELEGTEYWQTKNEAQRNWLWLTVSDPMEAKRVMDDNAIVVANQLQSLGIAGVPDSLLDYMTNQFTQGNWSKEYLGEQTRALSGANTSTGLDAGLRKHMKINEINLDVSDAPGEQIRQLYSEWLGPVHPPNERQIRRWSRQWRTNPEEARADLTARLRQQRKALYPEYEDDSLTYDDIAEPWRGFMAQYWGQTPDETDNVFQKLIKLNDSVEGGKLLRQVGYKRGNETVQREMLGSLMDTIGGPRRTE